MLEVVDVPYRRAARPLIHLAVGSRANFAYAVSSLETFAESVVQFT